MHGFAVQISLNGIVGNGSFVWKPLFEFQSKHISRHFESENVRVEQFCSEKFIDQKLWIDTNDFFCVTDGVVTNLKDLKIQYNCDSNSELLTVISKSKEFFKAFTGHFAGFIWYKNNNEFIAFNNHCGTKKVFYYQDKRSILFATDLFTLSRKLDELNISKSIDNDAAYLLLTSGFMHEDYTLIKEVKQLRAGECAVFGDDKFKIQSYFNLKNIIENNDTKEVIINQLEELFVKAIRTEFDLDETANKTPLTTLSGGLDSRMVALMSNKVGYRNQKFINFSEKGYADEIIARQIAETYQVDMFQIPLSAMGLCAIDEVVSVNDGLTLYTGSGHVFEALRKLESTAQIDVEKIGFVHTGMIGDAVLGSFLTSTEENKPKLTDGLYSKGLLHKVSDTLKKHIEKYDNEELYKFYNRAFLGANNGFLYFDLIGESSSAFLFPEFLSYAYAIPRKYKFNEQIYIDWIKSRHPEFSNFKWEAIAGKPTNNNLVRQFYRYRRAVAKRLPFKSMWKNNMNPEQIWYDNFPYVKDTLDQYFEINKELPAEYAELNNDLIWLYKNGNITEKTQVLTFLSAYKLLFSHV